jgi:hypothetical protein
MNEEPHIEQPKLSDVKSQWGKQDRGNFGYASDEERLEKRGMEDWELVEKLQESQPNIPYWFIAVVVIVLLVGVGLSFPFWGLRPGVKVNWVDWVEDPGFLGAIVYVAVAGLFVRYMTNLYGSSTGGASDTDAEGKSENSSGKQE